MLLQLLGPVGAEAQVVEVVLERRAGRGWPGGPAGASAATARWFSSKYSPNFSWMRSRRRRNSSSSSSTSRSVGLVHAGRASAGPACAGPGGGLPHFGRGIRRLHLHQRPDRVQEAAVAQGQCRLGAHHRALVGERGQQELARAAVLELAHEVEQQAAGRGLGGRKRALQLRAARPRPGGAAPRAPSPAAPGSGRSWSRAGPAARGVADLAQRRHGGAAHRGVVVRAAAPAGAGVALVLRMRPSAVAAAQRTLQCSSSSASSSGGTACRSPMTPRLSAAARRRSRSASPRTPVSGQHRRRRADGAERLHRGEAQLLALVGEERQQARHGVRAADLAERAHGHEAHLGVGVVEQRQRGRRAVSGSWSLPSETAPPAGAPGCSRRRARRAAGRRTPSASDLAQRLDGGAAHGLARVAAERDAAPARCRGRAGGRASRRRGPSPRTSVD